MKEIVIYEYQLKDIQNALRLTKNIYVDGKKCRSCYDRMVIQAKKFAENALEGKKDEQVLREY